MKRRIAAAAYGLAACLMIAGCGGSATSEGPVPSPPSRSTATTHPQRARLVTVVRTGGLKAGVQRFVFTTEAPPPLGFTKAHVREVLAAAADPRLLRVRLTMPANTCCDRYLYRITVTLADGTARRFATVDGAPWPRVFRTFVSLLS